MHTYIKASYTHSSDKSIWNGADFPITGAESVIIMSLTGGAGAHPQKEDVKGQWITSLHGDVECICRQKMNCAL